jgi:hypothetical protein
MRSLFVFLVDLIAYPFGKAVDRQWEFFDFEEAN